MGGVGVIQLLNRLQLFVKSYSTVVFAALLIPLFQPGSLDYIPGSTVWDIVFKVGKVAAVVLVTMFVALQLRNKKKVSPLLLAMLLLCIVALIATLITGEGLNLWVTRWLVYLIGVELCAYAFSIDRGAEFCKALCIVTGIISIINLISIILVPGGIYTGERNAWGDCYFWGHRNTIYQIVLASVAPSAMLDARAGKRVSRRTVFLSTIGFAQVMLAFSATSVIAFGVFMALWIIFANFKRLRPIVNGITIAGLEVLFFVSVVLLNLQTYLADFFALLGKSVTLTGRTAVWRATLDMLSGPRLLIGYGASDQLINVPGNWQSPFAHPHNELLNVLVIGGVLALVVYVLIIYMMFKSLRRMRETGYYPVLAATVGCLAVIATTESLSSSSFFVLLAIIVCQSTVGMQREKSHSVRLQGE